MTATRATMNDNELIDQARVVELEKDAELTPLYSRPQAVIAPEWTMLTGVELDQAIAQGVIEWGRFNGCTLNREQHIARATQIAFIAKQSKAVEQYSDIVSDGGLDPRNKFDVQQPATPKEEGIARGVRRIYAKVTQ